MNHFPELTTLLPNPSLATIESVTPEGVRINWRSTTWNAQLFEPCDRTFAPGQTVWVIGFYNIDLLITTQTGAMQ